MNAECQDGLPVSVLTALGNCERVARESGAWESYRAVGEAFAVLRATLEAAHHNAQPASPERKPLTREESQMVVIGLGEKKSVWTWCDLVRAVEAAHGIAATQEPRT